MSGPSIRYVLPFVVFILFLAGHEYLPIPAVWEYPFRVAAMAAVLWFFSRGVVDLKVRNWAGTIGIGVGVFAIWIAPDLLWPHYRDGILFQNAITGKIVSSVPEELRSSWIVLFFRTIRAATIVPIVEELFWRAWLMRWIINPDFEKVPLGAYAANAFWITAALFASEHGPYWEVGLIAGIAYNWWMVRTKSLGDCILAHAITNGLLSAYVIVYGQWQYW
jgi:CAAX prenyl protease-like protein